MPNKGDVHVVPQGNKWAIEVEGSSRASSTHNTQAKAIPQARRIAQQNHTELLIHGKDGKVRERNSYGNDPYPPKG